MGNTRRIPNADSESEVRSAFQRLDSDVTTLEDGTMSVDAIAAVGSLIVKDSDITKKSYDEFSQGTNNQVLVSAGVGVIPVWTTDLDGLTLLTVDNITINGAEITSDTGAISFGNENLTTAGTITGGKVTIFSPTPILVFQDSNSLGAASIGYIEWKDSGGGRAGFFGNSSSGDDDLHWKNEQGGHIKIETTGAGECQIFANVDLDNNNFITTGTLGAGAATVTSLTDSTATLTGGSLTSVKLGTLTTNGFVKTSGADGTLSVDTATYLTAESDTLDTVADRGATTDQTLIAGGFTTTGVVTVGAAADMVITVGSITSVSGAISFGNENLSTSGTLSSGYFRAIHNALPTVDITRTTTSTSRARGVFYTTCETAGDAVDGFGPGFLFTITDSGVTNSLLCGIYGLRAGGDTTGDLVFYCNASGSFAEKMRLSSAGVLSGATSLIVDNITLDGETITSDTGKIGMGTPGPLAPLHIQVSDLGTDWLATTTITTLAVVDTNAILDLVSDDNGEWGSAVSLKQVDGTAYENAWSIIRQTDGDGPGDGSLRFTYGTSVEAYLNSTLVAFATSGDIVLNKTSGIGFKVDPAAPTFPWRDLTGAVVVKATGAGRPVFSVYKGNIEEYQFAINDKAEFTYHIPHDYVPGSDIFLHVHWSHISASVTGGTVTFGYELTYAKGHNQSPFGANKTGTIAGTASAVQYQHIVSEVQISASSPSASQIDSDDLEPDGLILVELFFNANNMTGATPDLFVHEMDIHYQSMNVGTKQNAPDFYT